jgi:hypothetical protein
MIYIELMKSQANDLVSIKSKFTFIGLTPERKCPFEEFSGKNRD